MALTDEQVTLLTTAIENLNKSTQINQEVLEIIKNLGNTGVVDIATHNNDTSAHPDGFVNLLSNPAIFAGQGTTFTTTTHTIPALAYMYAGNTSGVATVDLYAKFNESNVSALRGVRASTIIPEGDVTSGFISGIFQARGFIENTDSSWRTYGQLTFHRNMSYENYAAITVIQDKNSDYSVSCGVIVRHDCIRPYQSSKAYDLGTTAAPFANCYLTASPTVTSDRNYKQDIADVDEAVFTAWGNVNFRQFRFKDAVAEKGDSARTHFGLIAQEIVEAFEAQGLDATKYGIVCHDSWDDQYETEDEIVSEAEYDENGKLTKEEVHEAKQVLVKAAGEMWTVRYEECLALEAAYQRYRLERLEAKLAA